MSFETSAEMVGKLYVRTADGEEKVLDENANVIYAYSDNAIYYNKLEDDKLVQTRYMDGELTPGIQLILDAVHIEDEMKDADVVVTGEGCLDHQTAMGKAPVGVAKLGRKYGAKTIAFAGSVTKEAVACNEAGIDAFFPIVRGISTLEEAMDPDTAKANMAAAAEQVFRLL